MVSPQNLAERKPVHERQAKFAHDDGWLSDECLFERVAPVDCFNHVAADAVQELTIERAHILVGIRDEHTACVTR